MGSMKNVKIIGNIYETSDYSLFVKLPSNRDLLLKRLTKIMESLSIREIMNPIVVNKRMEIIDGQGRFEAKKMLKRPIQFVVEPEATVDDCRRMNAYNTSWKTEDFARSFAADGNEDCKRLVECCDEAGITIALGLRLVNKAKHSKSKYGNTTSLSALEKLSFTENDADMLRDVWRKINEIKDALILTKRLNEAFCKGVKIMTGFSGYDHDSMIKRCKKEKNTFSLASNVPDMLKEFSRIYNANRSANKRLYFEDYMRNKGYEVRDYDFEDGGGDVSTLKTKKSRA